jgi:hypothetical protein
MKSFAMVISALLLGLLAVHGVGCSSQPEVQGTYIGNRGGKDVQQDGLSGVEDAIPVEDTGGGLDVVQPDGAELDSAETGNWPQFYGTSCPLDENVGRIKVYHEVSFGVTTGYIVAGEIEDGIRSGAIRIPGKEKGFCRMMELINPFCEPLCPDLSKEQCLPDGTCSPYPITVSGGMLTVTGLNEEVEVAPDSGKKYSKWDFNGDLFAVGQQIEMTIAGDEVDGLSMQGHGLELLDLTVQPKTLEFDSVLGLEWIPSDGPGTVFAMISIGNHADSPSSIWCELPEDSGILEIDSELANDLLKDWKAGTITASLFRQTVDSASLNLGCLEFLVYSEVTWDMKVAGQRGEDE